VKLPFDSLVAL